MSHKNCPTKLQVSNLAKDTTHREIEAWMSGLRVGGATITKKKDSFILEFESAAQAARAKEILSKNTYINGNVCKVVHYREFMVVGEVTAVVQGLTTESNFAAIEQVIRQFPGVTEVSFKKKTTKPYAFVSFEKMDQVNNMIKELHGSWVHGDFLRIFIVSDNTGSTSSPNLNSFMASGGEGLSDGMPGGDGTSPMVGKNLRTRSTSLNTHISFDTFLSNISSNLASLTPINSNPRRNSYNANFTSFTNPTSFTNVPTFTPSPVSPNIALSPLTPGTPTNGVNSINNNRKSRSKSLNTGSKVYVPVSPNLQSPISVPTRSAIASPILNNSDPNYNNENNTPTPTKGRTVSFSEEDENIIFPVIPLDDSMDVKPIRVRSVSFDSSINTLDSFDSEADTYSPGSPPNELSPRLLINSNALSPNALNSPTNRLRSKSVGTAPPKSKASVKNPANDLFLKQHRGSKIPNPNSPSSPDSFTSADGDDEGSEASSAVSPSGSANGTLSMPNLHYKNDYHTLRLEELDEEITSSILYDLFNCVLDEPPSLLSAKAVHGQGFVDFDSAEMANLALEKLNGRKFMGNVLRIAHVKPEEKCVLKVTNLPFSTDEKDLEEHFSDVAGLISANIVRKVTGISKGFAFLVFGHSSAAEKALQEKHGTIVQGRPINIRHHNSSNNNTRANTVKTATKPTQSPTINPTSDSVSSPNVFNSPNPASPPPQVIPGSDVSALKPGIKPARLGDVPKETGEQPDDAALTNNADITDEEAQKYLVQFSQEFAQVVQKVHTIETNYMSLKERLRQNMVRIDAAKTKLAEKRLEQLNDDLAYTKQKQQFKQALSMVASVDSLASKIDMHVEGLDELSAANGISTLEKERYHAKRMRAMKQASLRKLTEELSDQLELAKIVKEIEEEKQLLENHQVQLEMIEMIHSLAETIKKIPIPKLKERIAQSNANIYEKTKIKEDLQRFLDLKRSYDIDLDSPSPPRALSMAWPNDEAVKIDTFQLHFTDDRFSLRCCNIQLTRASIRPKAFSRGITHLAYWIKLASDPKAMYVAKGPIMSRGEGDKFACMQDITAQLYANNTAKAFNEKKLPKTVEYIPIQLLCFYQRNPQVYMTIEPYLDGIWKRYTTNSSGLINAEKNAYVHAYSHFSYEYSMKKLIVTDLQGGKLNNRYFLTGPAVHYVKHDDAFGKSNMGQLGIDEFFRSHNCNRICRALNLAPQHTQLHGGPIAPPYRQQSNG
eukprot:Phypoly_transcript_00681.p1 GENE.Phypoly_transcript_00681~~Phypoly_transcript_00681.p1  ORF type:complete len:1230 (+),score=215.76 Phypoly_transcript_00681:352-4041(+)